MVRCVTFDCAGTLVKLHCSVEQAVVAVANADPMEGQLFQAMFMGRLSAFHQVNLTRDPQQGRVFWVQLLADWLVRIGRDPKTAEDLQNRVDTSIFSEPSCMFSLFEDVLPCLECLKARGIRMAVLSNWDYSLHRVLQFFEISGFFEAEVASLEEGMEKPDPRLFALTLERLGASPEETVHIGDHLIDDVEGAMSAGITPVFLDRASGISNKSTISSLAHLEAAIWSA